MFCPSMKLSGCPQCGSASGAFDTHRKRLLIRCAVCGHETAGPDGATEAQLLVLRHHTFNQAIATAAKAITG